MGAEQGGVAPPYLDSCSRTASSTAASASGRFSGCLPPACAKSGRPPPPPPTMGDRRLTSSPALIRGVRSLVTAATRLTLSSEREPITTPPEPSLEGRGS